MPWRIAQLVGSPSRGGLNVLEVELRLEAHRVFGEEFQTTGRVEAQHYILEVGIQVAEAILAIKDLPFGSVRVSRPGEKDAIELDTRFQFVSERMSKSGRHPLDADVLTGHEALDMDLCGCEAASPEPRQA